MDALYAHGRLDHLPQSRCAHFDCSYLHPDRRFGLCPETGMEACGPRLGAILCSMQRRLFSSKLPASKGVTAEYNTALFNYQQDVSRLRRQYAKELANQPTAKAAKAEEKAAKRADREQKWRDYLQQVRKDLANPQATLYRDRHRCRPIIKVKKTEEDRKGGVQGVSDALGKHQVARRKALVLLDQQLRERPLITMENVDEQIQQALTSPVNYHHTMDEMVKAELEHRKRLAAVEVPRDPLIHSVLPSAHNTLN